ncbi:MAG TPA: FAD-dependent monooxygenase [Mycobacterium sp.]|uniref:FAD-dependent monooxygenase n=1 Tax=Mycobacterium sp. TaxID=1785 RepID=UPI002C00EF8E|nr:FAD-dependent monooxygenase [Mycobacterium sp.]HME74763.1 FAD-dependent monooxygenase [Mycobacterium sp.]
MNTVSHRQPELTPEQVPVLIAGGGPVGLTLALALARHGVAAILVERNPSTTTHPKMDITNGRSMELFRHLGVADELRKVAVPEDHPFDVSWVTNLDGWELARFRYPTPAQQRALIRECNDGTMALEPAMRVSQALLEPALKNILETRAPQIDIRFGWGLDTFTQDPDGVDAVIRCSATGEARAIRAQFLAGCDGAGSVVRTGLGIGLDDIDLRRLALRELGFGRLLPAAIRAYLTDRERPMDGRIFLIHFTSPNRELFEQFGTAWHTQSPEGWTLISQNDRDTWTLHALLGAGSDVDAIDPRQFLFAKLGIEFDCDIICANEWRPRLSLADSYGNGRVWLAGDSAHQVVPTGGYGMNTGVGDAVGLGWMLAAIVQGWGDHRLLEAYEAERRSVAVRNRTASARHTLVRLAIKTFYRKAIHTEGWNGERNRRRLGREILDLGNLENEANGIEFGYRYDSSPVVCPEPRTAPADHIRAYTPGTQPGVRPPSLLLEDGQAIFDLFGLGFTLLRFADLDVDAFVAAAADRGMPLKIVDIREDHARRLYERDLVLIRPDHHVAWRGDNVPDQPGAILDRIRGVAKQFRCPPRLVDSTT